MDEVREASMNRIAESVSLDGRYLTLMCMAGILSSVALLTNSVPVLIGAMIIAPAFAPLALVAYALISRQPAKAARGAGIAAVGIFAAAVAAAVTTWLMNAAGVIPPETNLLNKALLQERVTPGWWSLVAAAAAGIAGTIAIDENKTDALVGTVAALALVPAAAAAGIAFISADPVRGLGGIVLLTINVALIVIGGLVTLMFLQTSRR